MKVLLSNHTWSASLNSALFSSNFSMMQAWTKMSNLRKVSCGLMTPKWRLLTINVWFSSGKKKKRHSDERIPFLKSSMVVGASWDRVRFLPVELVHLWEWKILWRRNSRGRSGMETSGSLQKNLVLGQSGPTSETMIPDVQAKFW